MPFDILMKKLFVRLEHSIVTFKKEKSFNSIGDPSKILNLKREQWHLQN